MQEELYQLELTYQWNQSFFGGIYGSYDQFQHDFSSGKQETGRMLGGGLLGGANLKLLDRLYLQPKVGLTIGDGDYTPPVPDDINDHPDYKKFERDYLYKGLDLSLGLIFRSTNKLDLSLTLQYTHENWELQPFEEIKNPYYPFVSPENHVFDVFRFQVGLNYRFSAPVFRKADPTSEKDG